MDGLAACDGAQHNGIAKSASDIQGIQIFSSPWNFSDNWQAEANIWPILRGFQ